MNKYLRHLSYLDQGMVLEYGSKAVTLALLWQKGYNIPDGYCISAIAFERFCSHNHITSSNMKDAENSIIDGIFPIDLQKEIEEIWRLLDLSDEESLIVRSSAIGEDGDKHSFAGIYESVINIRSISDLEKAIKRCWSSYYLERALFYKKGKSGADRGMAVIIQKIICGDSSGVIFTKNPILLDDDTMVIEAYPGLNCGVVDGSVDADTYIVKRCGTLVKKFISHKKFIYSLSGVAFGVEIKNLENEHANKESLSENHINALIKIGIKLETDLKMPCDIEWTIQGDAIYIFQARPIIENKISHAKDEIPFNSDIQEDIDCTLLDRYSQPACICYLSLLQSWENDVYLSFYNKKRGEDFNEKPLLFYFNRVYWNLKYQREYFDDYQMEQRSIAGIIKKLKLYTLMLNGYKSWYRRLKYYDNFIEKAGRKNIKVAKISQLIEHLDKILDVFCNYIGKDHFRFLGLAQVSHSLLSKGLEGMSEPKEIITEAMTPIVSKNMTMQSNKDLMALVREVKLSKDIHKLFHTENAGDIYKYLKGSKEKETFRKNFEQFIYKHGHRGTSCDDLLFPHWADEPSIVLKSIKQFLGNPMHTQDDTSRNSSRQSWQKYIDEYIASLKIGFISKKIKKRHIFLLVQLTGKYMALREDQRYYFDKSWILIRKILLEIGTYLAALEIIQHKEHIFHLTISEIRDICRSDNRLKERDWKTVIYKRIKTYEKNTKITPPYLIKNNELIRLHKEAGKTSYKAIGISPGKAVGTVRIIRSVNDLGKVEQGDIAIVSTFHPSWTPILGIVNGLVMDYGNILSHGAVMAREYGIPVVVFNDIASQMFSEGEWMEIDGSTGRIRMLQ